MAFRRENMRRVSEILAQRRAAAENTAKKNTEKLYAQSMEAKEIDAALSGTGLALVRIALSRGDVKESIEALRKENEALQARRKTLLSELGLPADYTDVRYTCAVCRDTGYTEKGMCACMRRLLTEEGFRTSGLGGLIEKQSFDNFSLHFYNGDDKAAVETALTAAKQFAEDFDKTHANLLFIGGTGLGKTHLSTAIARRAIERGQDVVYETAQNVIADFEHDRFHRGYDKDEEERSARYLEADLLIMDDLGAELTNQFTVSSLYNIINTRINQGKSMIISTNLGQKGLIERYDERITSRLFGEFYPFLFRGKDVRGQK